MISKPQPKFQFNPNLPLPSKAKLLRLIALWEKNKTFILSKVELADPNGKKYFPYDAELQQEKIDYVKNRYKSILE